MYNGAVTKISVISEIMDSNNKQDTVLMALMTRFVKKAGKDIPSKIIKALWEGHGKGSVTLGDLYSRCWKQTEPPGEFEEDVVQTQVTRARGALRKFREVDFFARREFGSIEILSSPNKKDAEQTRLALDWAPAEESAAGAAEELWRSSVFDDEHSTLVISTEPTVFADPDRQYFVRFLNINSKPDDPAIREEIDRFIMSQQDPDAKKFFRKFLCGEEKQARPCYHYQPSGEVLAALHLDEWFSKAERKNVERENTRENNSKPVQACNRLLSKDLSPLRYAEHHAVILGNIRTNVEIAKLQANHPDYPYKMDENSIIGPGGPYADHDETVYCLVSRFASPTGKLRTVIAAHNGRGVQAVSQCMTDNRKVRDLAERLEIRISDLRYLDRFQALYKVTIDKGSEKLGRSVLLKALR